MGETILEKKKEVGRQPNRYAIFSALSRTSEYDDDDDPRGKWQVVQFHRETTYTHTHREKRNNNKKRATTEILRPVGMIAGPIHHHARIVWEARQQQQRQPKPPFTLETTMFGCVFAVVVVGCSSSDFDEFFFLYLMAKNNKKKTLTRRRTRLLKIVLTDHPEGRLYPQADIIEAAHN
ncbi:hypothetical protein OUZ56_002602 [Daphnia magna]|uniref:Uncharacterized protein n=1 Tax=Daphnia magna TaxID=35525 RepID=A0ABR0A699_9CRUS|nr:hypothetical protein OUZ56_002602 [Daphnia magna]